MNLHISVKVYLLFIYVSLHQDKNHKTKFLMSIPG